MYGHECRAPCSLGLLHLCTRRTSLGLGCQGSRRHPSSPPRVLGDSASRLDTDRLAQPGPRGPSSKTEPCPGSVDEAIGQGQVLRAVRDMIPSGPSRGQQGGIEGYQ